MNVEFSILHTTDLHYNKKHFNWIALQQDRFDIFCISGDLLDSSKNDSLEEQVNWVSSWIKKFDKPLFVCTGNHDIEFLDDEEWLNRIDASNFYQDNTVTSLHGVTIGCHPYIDPDGYLPFYKCDILITHLPPANTATSTDVHGNDWGDEALYQAIVKKRLKPKAILCGHMHSPIKTVDSLEGTKIYNPGADVSGGIPRHHEISLSKHVV